jgi:hypothetical protein
MSSNTVNDKGLHCISQVGELHRGGKLREAEKLYAQLLPEYSQHSVLLHRYGALLAQLHGTEKVRCTAEAMQQFQPAHFDAHHTTSSRTPGNWFTRQYSWLPAMRSTETP